MIPKKGDHFFVWNVHALLPGLCRKRLCICKQAKTDAKMHIHPHHPPSYPHFKPRKQAKIAVIHRINRMGYALRCRCIHVEKRIIYEDYNCIDTRYRLCTGKERAKSNVQYFGFLKKEFCISTGQERFIVHCSGEERHKSLNPEVLS